MADSDLKITITTVADVAAVKNTSDSLDNIGKSSKSASEGVNAAARELNILDSNQAMSLEKKRANEAAFAAWQKELMEARKGTSSAMASSVVTAEETMAAAARKAAAEAALAAAELEAAEVKAAIAAEAMAAASAKSKIGVAEMGNAFGYAARAANDMTRGGRGMLGNVSHLVTTLGGGAGLAGVVGALSMGLVILWPHLKKLWEDVEEPKRLEAWKTHLEQLAAAAGKFANENSVANYKKWIESLTAEAKGIGENSKALERNIELIQTRRRAQMEVDDAQAALDMQKIDSDKSMSEPDKIRARAGVADSLQKKKESAHLAGLADEPDKLERASDEAKAKARVADEAAAKSKKDKDDLEEETRRLTGKRNASIAAEQALPDAKASLKKTIQKEGGWGTQEEADAATKQIPILKQQIAQYTKALDGYSQADRERLGNLDGSSEHSQKLRTLATEESAKLAKEAEQAHKAAKDAFTAWKQAAEKAKIEAEAVLASGRLEREKSALQETSAEESAREKMNAEDLKASDASNKAAGRMQKGNLRGDLSTAKDRLNDTAREESNLFAQDAGKTTNAALHSVLEKIAKALENGTNGNELATVHNQFTQATKGMGGITISLMQKAIAEMEKQAAAIKTLEAQIKNNP